MLSLISWPMILLAQAQPGGGSLIPGPSSPAQGASPMQVNNLWDFVIKGGPVMILIGLCSLVALTIIIERSIVIRRRRVIPRGFINQIKAISNDRAKALELSKSNPSPMARVLEAAIKNADQPGDVLDRRVEETGQREVVGLRHRMRLLSALPQVSTLLGLLGTVFGMIKTFQVVALTSEALGKTEMLAKGIFEAWTCTAAGLLVAIVVLVAYHLLMGR